MTQQQRDRKEYVLSKLEALGEKNEKQKIEIANLKSALNGTKVKKVRVKADARGDNDDRYRDWVVDVYTVQYGYVKNSMRRKLKGKSKKKLKMSKKLVKAYKTSFPMKEGVMEKIRSKTAEAVQGHSVRNHVFKTRNTRTSPYPA
jgi:hypothetical protein